MYSACNPRKAFKPNAFTARCRILEEPAPEMAPQEEPEEQEEVMIQKQEIEIEREENKKKMLPGQRLLKKLHRKQQLENSLVRVIGDLKL